MSMSYCTSAIIWFVARYNYQQIHFYFDLCFHLPLNAHGANKPMAWICFTELISIQASVSLCKLNDHQSVNNADFYKTIVCPCSNTFIAVSTENLIPSSRHTTLCTHIIFVLTSVILKSLFLPWQALMSWRFPNMEVRLECDIDCYGP